MSAEEGRKPRQTLVPVQAFAKIFWVLAAVLFALAVLLAASALIARPNSRTISGTVIGLDVVQNAIPYTDEDSGFLYYPIIQYEGEPDLSEYYYMSPQPVRAGRFTIGDEVELRMTRGGRVFLDTVWGQWGIPLVFLGCALIFTVSALAISRLGRTVKRRN